jgi:cytochrome c-type biogenesis protein CcmH
MHWLRCLVVAAAVLASPHAMAVQPDEVLPNPAKEARARELSKQLRCMVCQNQSIDDSDAPLARDLRLLVRERLQAGDSNQQVLDFLVQRYGEFVLLRPRLGWRTALLWLTAPVLLVGGGLVLFVLARRRGRHGAAEPAIPQGGALSADEERRLARLMTGDDRQKQ